MRRLLTIPGYVMAWALWLAALPLWLPVAFVVDAIRGSRATALRCSGLVAFYLTCEVLGLAASAGLWLWKHLVGIDDERWRHIHFRLEAWWGTTLFRALVWLFGLRVEVRGEADLGRGPYLLLLRHSSTADTLLASALICRPHDLHLRYVLKKELLWDPCLDVVGHRLPNVFVDRTTDDTDAEVGRVQSLAEDLGPRDGVLIYPEGTRFSPRKRSRVLERFRREGDSTMLAYAESLAFVLPPRLGGTLALLEAAPKADVVVCAHTGFEGSASLARIWNGALVDQVIRIEFRRIRREDIPSGREARAAWILDEWQRLGAWVERHRVSGPAS